MTTKFKFNGKEYSARLICAFFTDEEMAKADEVIDSLRKKMGNLNYLLTF